VIACPQMSLIEFKKFNMHIVSPHELLMALEPEIFEWECKIITDFNILLSRYSNLNIN
jgi:diphthamide synthase subunit DPH2